jgi:hypothetical protein
VRLLVGDDDHAVQVSGKPSVYAARGRDHFPGRRPDAPSSPNGREAEKLAGARPVLATGEVGGFWGSDSAPGSPEPR